VCVSIIIFIYRTMGYSKNTTFSPCSSWSATLSLDVARSAGPDNMAVAKVRKTPKAAVYKPDPVFNVKSINRSQTQCFSYFLYNFFLMREKAHAIDCFLYILLCKYIHLVFIITGIDIKINIGNKSFYEIYCFFFQERRLRRV